MILPRKQHDLDMSDQFSVIQQEKLSCVQNSPYPSLEELELSRQSKVIDATFKGAVLRYKYADAMIASVDAERMFGNIKKREYEQKLEFFEIQKTNQRGMIDAVYTQTKDEADAELRRIEEKVQLNKKAYYDDIKNRHERNIQDKKKIEERYREELDRAEAEEPQDTSPWGLARINNLRTWYKQSVLNRERSEYYKEQEISEMEAETEAEKKDRMYAAVESEKNRFSIFDRVENFEHEIRMLDYSAEKEPSNPLLDNRAVPLPNPEIVTAKIGQLALSMQRSGGVAVLEDPIEIARRFFKDPSKGGMSPDDESRLRKIAITQNMPGIIRYIEDAKNEQARREQERTRFDNDSTVDVIGYMYKQNFGGTKDFD